MKPLEHGQGGVAGTQRTILVLIVLTTALGPFTLNMPLPSMPGMATSFGVPYGVMQLVLTVYLLALAVGQLVYGPLSDRFGRRPVLITGLAVFVAGGAICAWAPTVDILVAGRAVQGFGGCAGMVLGRAMLRDLYGRDRAASLIAYVTMAMAVAPMIAPALGGLIDEMAGWRATFTLMAALGAVMLAATVARLPETHLEPTVGAGLRGLVIAARTLLANPVFLAYAAVMAFTSSMFFSFLAGAPYIVVELMDRSPSVYGFWFIAISGGFMIGNFLTGRYAARVGVLAIMRIGTIGNLAAVVLVIVAMSVGPFEPATLFVPMGILTFFNGLLMPTSIASVVSVRPDLAGAASGLGGAMQMAAAAVMTTVVASLLSDSAVPMIAVIALCGVLSAGGVAAAQRLEAK